MEVWKTGNYFLGPAGHKREVSRMTYVGVITETAFDIHTHVLLSSRNSSNLVMQRKK